MKEIRKKATGNQDEREKSRALSPAEQKRLEKFDALSDEMLRQGYKKVELTVSIVKANVFAIVLLVPLLVIGMGLFYLKNGTLLSGWGAGNLALFVIVFILLTVVHELIHGISWSFFTEHGFKDIEFGFMKQYLTPYCTCLMPLNKKQYIFGAIMPFILLGAIPMMAGILTGSSLILFLGILMADAAAGDLMIIWNIMRYKSESDRIVYIDHPTQAGGVIFEG